MNNQEIITLSTKDINNITFIDAIILDVYTIARPCVKGDIKSVVYDKKSHRAIITINGFFDRMMFDCFGRLYSVDRIDENGRIFVKNAMIEEGEN